MQGKLEEAISFFKKSLIIFEDARGNYNIAGAYRNLGNLSLSIKHYRRAVEIGSGDAEFYSDLGDALWHEGNIKEANRFLRMAVEVNSSHPRSNYQLGVFFYMTIKLLLKLFNILNLLKLVIGRRGYYIAFISSRNMINSNKN